MQLQAGNLFDVPASLSEEEFFEKLVNEDLFFIERIISEGHVTPDDEWYDQDTNEFVLLVTGSAELEFADGKKIKMKPGNHLIIPKHVKHRVSRTDTVNKTFWLAVHYR